jgi:hypothetical protein
MSGVLTVLGAAPGKCTERQPRDAAHKRLPACAWAEALAKRARFGAVQVSRDDFLEPHFNCTFDALFRLVADPDPAVHQATTFLDALMKARGQPCPSILLACHKPAMPPAPAADAGIVPGHKLDVNHACRCRA